MKNIILLLAAVIISCNTFNVKANSFQLNKTDSFYSSTGFDEEDNVSEIESNIVINNQIIKNACREIWNDNLFKTNKTEIFKKVNSKDNYISHLYITEILTRMLKEEQFKNNLLNDEKFNEIKGRLYNYMEEGFADDYFTYYNYAGEKPEYYKKHEENYKKWLLNSIYDLGYDDTQDFEEYAEKCMRLYTSIV